MCRLYLHIKKRLTRLDPPQGASDTSLIARRVGIINFVTAAAPSCLARFGLPAHPGDLARHRCVNYFSAKTGKVYDWDVNRDGPQMHLGARPAPAPSAIATT